MEQQDLMSPVRDDNSNRMEKLVSLCKRRGFVYQGSEIYGGLAGTWDYGPLGVAIKKNIENLWWKRFVLDREDMYGIDAAILMNQDVWKASGHVGGFSDPLVEDLVTKKRYRADHLLEAVDIDPRGMTLVDMDRVIKEQGIKSPDGNKLGEVRQFNMMLQTNIGAVQDESSISYLRPETAQGMFVNFKNVLDSFHPKLPFGMAQIGKAFRNEIAPRDFIFRVRELEQMEIEYFVDPRNQETVNQIFDQLFDDQMKFLQDDLGLTAGKIHKIEIDANDRAHYSSRSVDTEFDFPFGQKELLGLAYRTDYDLQAHMQASQVDLSYFDESTKERFVPHCIEPTFGLGRLILATLSDAYHEDEMDGESRVVLKLDPKVAPYVCAVSPLLKNRPELQEKARAVFTMLKKKFGRVAYDDNGNIGKRYRRQDEIGTPWCVVIDFDTLGLGDNINPDWKDMVTVRDRDTGTQTRVSIDELVHYFESKF
jgi:glycyl-tRNA synthetase